jgi:hypothetical protein
MKPIGIIVHIAGIVSARGKLKWFRIENIVVVSEPVGPCFRNMPSLHNSPPSYHIEPFGTWPHLIVSVLKHGFNKI